MVPHDYLCSVADQDIDLLGHASNIAYVRWIQDAAVSHSEACGFDFANYKRIGGVFVVRRHEIDYLRSAVRSDQLLVRTWVPTAMAAKCERRTEIQNAVTGEIIAQALTIWGFLDVARMRPMRIPDEVRVAFGFPPRPTYQAKEADP